MHTLVLMLIAAPTTYPEALTRPVLAKVERFEWPAPDDFRKNWARRDAEGHQVVRGTVKESGGGRFAGWFLITDGVAHALALDPPRPSSPSSWRLFYSDGNTFEEEERLPNEMSDADLVAWTYVSTLVKPAPADRVQFDEPLHDVLRATDTPERLTAWLGANKADDAMFTRLLRWEPMGTCSMDDTPADAARLKAELAYARGDLGNFLRLQVNIMGDQFRRVAYSSYGEEAHETQADRLLSTGIDFEKFMLGLLITRPQSTAWLDAWRWARSVSEAGKAPAMRKVLAGIVEAPDSDAYTRLRATQAYAYLAIVAEPKRSRVSFNNALRVTQKLALHPLAAAWVKAELAER